MAHLDRPLAYPAIHVTRDTILNVAMMSNNIGAGDGVVD